MKLFAKFILIYILGWKIEGKFPTHLKKYVIIAAPHTHWQDFPIGILVKWSQGININFIGKSSLFKPPFGFIFRWLGGTPVNRSKRTNKVQAIIDVFNSKETFVLALSPEGTRKKVEEWKTGFYFIAKGANVPIVMATLDFEYKKVKISEPYYLTGLQEKDFKHFYQFYKGVKGKLPKNFNL
jgi:1-acyl-sn-glycerol-3-phosphate acyltransferase